MVEKKNIIEEYEIEMRQNPKETYEEINPELDDLSYLRTIIAHLEYSDEFMHEYEKMIDVNIKKIIEIIKEYRA